MVGSTWNAVCIVSGSDNSKVVTENRDALASCIFGQILFIIALKNISNPIYSTNTIDFVSNIKIPKSWTKRRQETWQSVHGPWLSSNVSFEDDIHKLDS